MSNQDLNKTVQLQQQELVGLKSEVYDLSRGLKNAEVQNKQLSEALQAIAEKLELVPSEDGQINISDIIDAVPSKQTEELLEAVDKVD